MPKHFNSWSVQSVHTKEQSVSESARPQASLVTEGYEKVFTGAAVMFAVIIPGYVL